MEIFRLEILNACDTGITEIIIPPEERLFLKLHTLYVSENYIKNVSKLVEYWELDALAIFYIRRTLIKHLNDLFFFFQYADIIDLNNLPALKDLRINKNPLTTSDKFLSYREKIVARVGNLKVFFEISKINLCLHRIGI